MKILNPHRFVKKPDAVLFDMDDTLYAYETPHRAALSAVREKFVKNFSASPDKFDLAYDRARGEVKARLKDTASSHSRLLYFQRLFEIIGLGSQVLLALDFEQAYWRTFMANATLFDGVKDLLDDLRLRGIPMAIVTNLTAQIQFRKIIYFDLDQYFDVIVTSEEAGFQKPHRFPFELAIEKLKPNGSNIWMVGEDAKKDIRGAKDALGAITLQKIHGGVQIGVGAAQPDCLVYSFREISNLLAKIVDDSPTGGNTITV